MTGAAWIVAVSVVYFIAGMVGIFSKLYPIDMLPMIYCIILSLPLWCPPFKKWIK